MINKKFSLSLIGVVLSSIVSGEIANATEAEFSSRQVTGQDQEVAALLAELIAHGHITVNAQTGSLQLKKSVLSILDDYGALQKGHTPSQALGGCSSTTEGGTMRPTR